ncbi:hypothetical protein JCM5296_005376 [Sporobolomyces johnsonii]
MRSQLIKRQLESTMDPASNATASNATSSNSTMSDSMMSNSTSTDPAPSDPASGDAASSDVTPSGSSPDDSSAPANSTSTNSTLAAQPTASNSSLPFPPKQDCTYFNEDWSSPSLQQQILAAVQANEKAAQEAIAAGKDAPNPADWAMWKRDQSQTNASWRWDFNGSTPIRGVNVGGWLVLEPWITPSLFDATGNASVVDEWTFCETLGYREAYARLSSHWSTFYTEDDFAQMASYGLNHVRIPIGYWAFDTTEGEPYVQGQYAFLLNAIQWAGNHGLKVMVDVHGAPASQNGFDNSGRRGPVGWHLSQDNVNRTLNVVSRLSQEFAKPEYNNTVTILQALNEPAGFIGQDMLDVYRQFAYDSYGRVRYPSGSTPSSVVLSLHDAFQPLTMWEKSFPAPNFQGVSLSDHPYFVFNESDLAMNQTERIKAVCSTKDYYAQSQSNLWTIIDEWTSATTDCAGSLNGRGIGSRYDGSYPNSTAIGTCNGKTGNGSTFSEDYKASLRQFWEAQVDVWEASTSGWIQWCWKAENADDWSYYAGVQGGWIPSDPTQRMYGDQQRKRWLRAGRRKGKRKHTKIKKQTQQKHEFEKAVNGKRTRTTPASTRDEVDLDPHPPSASAPASA